MHLHHEGLIIGVQCPLIICRGHIRTSKDSLQISLWLMVYVKMDILVKFLHFCLHFGCNFKGLKMD